MKLPNNIKHYILNYLIGLINYLIQLCYVFINDTNGIK